MGPACRIMRELAVFVFAAVPTAPAFAGIADSPLPVLQAGATTQFLYSVPGVIALPQIGTYFSCASTDVASMQVGVEVFGAAGGGPVNDASASSVTVPPGGTVVFGTSAAASFTSNDVGSGNGIGNASARILATSKKLICTAFLADPSNVPPTSMVHLDVVLKLKQKGD